MAENSAGHHFIILPHCTHPICFPSWKRQCFYSMQGVDDSPINVTTTIPATPSVFLGDIFRWAQSTILKWKGEELFLLILALPLQRGDSCLHTSREARVSGSQAPGSIKGGASHPGYWATSDGDCPVDFHSLLFQACSRSVFNLKRSHIILLRIVK